MDALGDLGDPARLVAQVEHERVADGVDLGVDAGCALLDGAHELHRADEGVTERGRGVRRFCCLRHTSSVHPDGCGVQLSARDRSSRSGCDDERVEDPTGDLLVADDRVVGVVRRHPAGRPARRGLRRHRDRRRAVTSACCSASPVNRGMPCGLPSRSSTRTPARPTTGPVRSRMTAWPAGTSAVRATIRGRASKRTRTVWAAPGLSRLPGRPMASRMSCSCTHRSNTRFSMRPSSVVGPNGPDRRVVG